MAKTIIPTWMRTAPEHLGSSGQGKLSADEWRSVCTVHMPPTLIRLWGFEPKESRQFKILDNTMNLVIAAKMSMERETHPEHRSTLFGYLQTYLKGIRTLFPDATIVANHHLSLHLVEFLERLGPPHSWWTFPFERFNGMIQKINTNYRFGELLLIFIICL